MFTQRNTRILVLIAAALDLSLASIQICPLGPLPSSGVIRFPISLPTSLPLISVPMQALIGLQFTNVEMIHVVNW